MRVNPDILETRAVKLVALEFARLCDLADTPYASLPHYTLLYVFSNTIEGKDVEWIRENFPMMVESLTALDKTERNYDWPTLALAIDRLRGHAQFSFDIP